MVAEVEVRVVDPDRVGQPAGHEPDPLAVARDERDPVADQLDEPLVVEPGLARARRSRRSRCASAWTGTPRRGTPGPAAAAAGSSRCPFRLGARPDPGTGPRRACSTWDSGRGERPMGARPTRRRTSTMRRCAAVLAVLFCAVALLAGCGDDEPVGRLGRHHHRDPDHRDHLLGRHRRAERRAGRGQGRRGDRRSRSRPTSRASCTCTRNPEQELPYGAGTTTLTLDHRRARRGRGRVPRPREGHRPARGQLTPRVDSDGITLAHGIGGAKDLPISPELAIAGAVAALTVSFTVLAIAWRKPRYDERTSGRLGARRGWPASSTRTAFRVGLRVLGLVVFLYAAMAAVLGKDLLTNPVFGMFYVWWWVGLVPRVAAVRPGVEGDQPGPHHQPRLREAVRQRPGPRRVRPTPSGSATGRRRSACSRSSGWSWSTRTPPSSGRCACGARSTSR